MSDDEEQESVPGFDPTLMRRRRGALKWTQGQLAVDVGVSHKTIVAWESGARRPGPANLVRLAKALGVKPDDLIRIDRDRWGLANLRVANGMDQVTAAKLLGISAQRLRHIEDGVNELDPDVLAQMTILYREKPEALREAWGISRERLMAGRVPLGRNRPTTATRETTE